MNRIKLLAGAAVLASLNAAAPAHALTFILNSTDAGTAAGTQARRGFEIAANYWSSVLTDDVTVNLNIGFRSLDPGVLAQAGSNRSLLSMQQIYGALAADATSTFDASSVATLQPLGVSALGAGFGAINFTGNAFNAAGTGYIDTATRFDNDGGVNNSTVAVTKASAKALGLTTDVNGNAIDYNSLDASITFSTNFAFDFTPGNGINSNAFDFIGVAIHEIGHSLGFTSGVDSYDFYTSPGNSATRAGALEGFVVNSSLDLFRFSAPGEINLSTQAPVYFSVDGGASQVFGESWMSTGRYNGDGRQASHFRDSPAGQNQIGIMDPTSGRGQMQEVTGTDIAAFDVVGWDLTQDTALYAGYRLSTADIYANYVASVPEPAVWMQLILGFGVIGGAYRRQRRKTVAYA